MKLIKQNKIYNNKKTLITIIFKIMAIKEIKHKHKRPSNNN
jgi:hypothetical protein